MVGSLGGSLLAIKYGYSYIIDRFALGGIIFGIFYFVFDVGLNYRKDYKYI